MQVFSCEYCKIFKIICFEEHLWMAASIRCYFDTMNLKRSGFCAIYSFKILVSEQKYKDNLKNMNLKKKRKLFYNSHMYYVYVTFSGMPRSTELNAGDFLVSAWLSFPKQLLFRLTWRHMVNTDIVRTPPPPPLFKGRGDWLPQIWQ